MANGLARLGQAARKLFGKKAGNKKVNISEVNKEKKNTPAVNSSRGGGYRQKATPGVIYKWDGISPVKKAYRAGRGFLTQNKPY